MELPPDLDALLCTRYPALFANRQANPNDVPMGRGFEIGPGWFALVDTLSAVLSTDPQNRALQVKSKFGGLRFHLDPGPRDPSALELVEGLSMRVCEVSGHPGRLCRYNRWIVTLAPGISLPHRDGIPETSHPVFNPGEPQFYIPPIGFTLEEMTAARAEVLAGPIDIPAGWHELADTVLQQLQHGSRQTRVGRMWVENAKLRIEWEGPELVSLSDMATALSRRFDPMTGFMA